MPDPDDGPGAPRTYLRCWNGWRSAVSGSPWSPAGPRELAVDYGGLAGVSGLVVLGHYGLERWEAAR